MILSTRWDYAFSFFSWLIVVALTYAAGSLFITPPSGAGPIASTLGAETAQYIYLVIYGGEAIALAVAKMFRQKVFRKHVLMVIYLTGFFTSLLTFLLFGPSIALIDNIVIVIASAGCWLYWKHKTEYVNPKEFEPVVEQLSDK